MIFCATATTAALGCSAIGKDHKAAAPAPQAQPPSPPAPPTNDSPKGIDLPLTAGATVIGRLSANEPCLPTFNMTIGDMLHTTGQPTADDEVHFAYDPNNKEWDLGAKYQGTLTREFDIFPVDGVGDVIASGLKAGKTLRLTQQPECATGTTAGDVILVKEIDMTPDAYNIDAEKYDFLDLKDPTAFGVTFSYDDSLSWQVNYTSTLTDDVLKGVGSNVHYAIYDTSAMALVVPWEEVSRDELLVGNIKITDPQQVRRILPSQTHLQLVFDTSAQDIDTPTFYVLDLGDLCKEKPSLFRNLAGSGKGCAQVTDADLSSAGH